ncbi:antitoxin VbhA family protein [Treponema phagedenis]|nr:antitoxin VbhA family protein [Treponema phagedenis]NVP23598.1 antitoxin VbhA family protein [Treponema phagedenis]QLC58429.1 antitoxin VbhA family protein [Treponema phagedenis]
MEKDTLIEYLKEKEPDKKEKKYSWYTAIGLQKVDGLETSSYLKEIAQKNIDGKISLEEAGRLLNSYYSRLDDEKKNTEEADKVSF